VRAIASPGRLPHAQILIPMKNLEEVQGLTTHLGKSDLRPLQMLTMR